MKKNDLQNFLKDEANALRVQNHQLENAQNKLSEVNSRLDDIQEYQKENSKFLDSINAEINSTFDNMENLLNNINANELQHIDNSEIQELISTEIKLDSIQTTIPTQKHFETIETLDTIEYDDSMSWEEYMKSIESYGIKYNLNLKQDPFKKLMSTSQRIELEKRIKEDFSYKNAKCDKYDYMIAGTCGVIGGLIDALFVGAPGSSALGNFTDEMANKATEKFAELIKIKEQYDKAKLDKNEKFSILDAWKNYDSEVINKGYEQHKKNKIKNNAKILSLNEFKRLKAIRILEGEVKDEGKLEKMYSTHVKKLIKKDKTPLSFEDFRKKVKYTGFRVNYEETSLPNAIGGQKLSSSNHHLLSLGHSPDLIGLFFSILNQFTNTSSFLSNGQLITIQQDKDSPLNMKMQGGNVIAKIFCGVWNWFGHLASDWVGSESSAKKGNRGSGIPIPFYNLFQLCDFGNFEKDRKTFAQITTQVFESGYDFRHGMAMAIPVAITKILIRFMYVVKARFYHKKDWKDCIPNANIPELRRMLTIGHGSLCLIDGADAAIRHGWNNPVLLLSRMNLIAWVRFGNLAIKEVRAWWLEGKMDIEKMDAYLDESIIKMNMRFRV